MNDNIEYGKYQNVHLTESEKKLLSIEYRNSGELIERLSEYKFSRGIQYISDYTALKYMAITEAQASASENEAKLAEEKITEHTDCEECCEDYYFAMKDNYHYFSIGLTTILSCLAFAEKEGAVPPLPEEWWALINRRY